MSYSRKIRMVSKSKVHFRQESRPAADDLARNHEHAVARVVQRFGVLRLCRDLRLRDLEKEEVVFVDQRIVAEPASELA